MGEDTYIFPQDFSAPEQRPSRYERATSPWLVVAVLTVFLVVAFYKFAPRMWEQSSHVQLGNSGRFQIDDIQCQSFGPGEEIVVRLWWNKSKVIGTCLRFNLTEPMPMRRSKGTGRNG